jgi:hypothetical protein
MIRIIGHAALSVASKASIEPERWVDRAPRLARMDRLSALAMVACNAAMLDAGLAPSVATWDGDRTGIVLGTAFGCHAVNEDYYRGVIAGEPSPRLFAYTLPSSPVGEISIQYRVRGAVSTVTAGRTAGLDALLHAQRMLRTRRADLVLLVTADVATPLLASLEQEPELVDAAAAWILERNDDAARGSRVLAVAQSHDRDPATALDAAVGAVAPRDAGPATERIGVGDLAATLASAPLIATTRWLQAGGREAIVAVSDRDGSAAAALIG